MHVYPPALEAAAPTVFMVWLRAWYQLKIADFLREQPG
jgi:hypothetical protein